VNVIFRSLTPGFSFFNKLSCDEETLSSCIIVIKRSKTYLSEIAEKSPQEVAEKKNLHKGLQRNLQKRLQRKKILHKGVQRNLHKRFMY
jgi:hypothetical protein